MPQYLICIYHIEGASPYHLHQTLSHVLEGTVRPDLYIAAKTDASSIDELKETVVKARWVTWNRYGFAFADKVPKEEYGVYLCSPFLERIPTDYPKHSDHLFRGVSFQPEFFTEIHDGWEYQDADFQIMLPEDAVNKWNRQEVAAALRFYEQLLLTEDAQKSAPENHECFFLRECLQLNRIASELLLPDTNQLSETIEDVPNETRPDSFGPLHEMR
ncbi:MAG: hypothetical protein FWH27_12590 [Planctomycetaceae bacterium]|nr:hypothetical protein [Planctomycetaceae bacterium]